MITIHTPKGCFTFDPDTVTNEELEGMGTKREYLPEPPRDPMEEIKARLDTLEKK